MAKKINLEELQQTAETLKNYVDDKTKDIANYELAVNDGELYLKKDKVGNGATDPVYGDSLTLLTADPDIYLTKDKYQYVTGVNTVDNLIWLPSTDLPTFLKIHLYAINCKMKSTFDNAVKWKNGQNPASGKFEMVANNIYEFVLTYINGSWIGEFITYDNA